MMRLCSGFIPPLSPLAMARELWAGQGYCAPVHVEVWRSRRSVYAMLHVTLPSRAFFARACRGCRRLARHMAGAVELACAL